MSKIKLEDLKYVGKEEAAVNAIDEEIQESIVEESVINDEGAEEVPREIEEIAKSVTEPEEAVSAENITSAVVDHTPSAIQNVKNIRIYSKPSILVPARSFTGNVAILGRIEDFTIIKYVRSGFGPVKGYTKDI